MKILWISAILVHLCSSETAPDLGQVVLSNVVFRHGNRTPIDFYPNDPYKDPSLWPTEFGQLVEDGMRQQFALGQWLRQRYSDFLSATYDMKDIHVQSTDTDRTLMSAQCNLAGLYEPDLKKNWNHNIRWRPIPIHSKEESKDKVLAAKKDCPRYDALYGALMSSQVIQDVIRKNQYLLDILTAATGEPVDDIESVNYIHDSLFIEESFGFKLPNWTESVYPEPMRSLAAYYFSLACFTPELARLKIGPLLKEIVKHMQEKVAKTLEYDRKMFVYSAHDKTIANIMESLNVYNGIGPPYVSTLLLELRQKDGGHFVTISYRNSTLTDPYLLTIPGCDTLCPLTDFLTIVKPILPKDWEAECQVRSLLGLSEYMDISTSVVAYISISALVLLILAVVVHASRGKRVVADSFEYQGLSTEAT